jgi:uncharacterized protein YbjT (DUF2867 family)
MTPTGAQKRLVIVGATGMVGSYALRDALDHPAVGGVTAIGRKPAGATRTTVDVAVGGTGEGRTLVLENRDIRHLALSSSERD